MLPHHRDRVFPVFFWLVLLLTLPVGGPMAGQGIRGLDKLGYGLRLYEDGQLPQAIAVLRDFLADQPDRFEAARAQFAIGDAYLTLEQWPEAEQAFLRFVTTYFDAPNLETGWVKLTEALEGQERYAEAARMARYGAVSVKGRGEVALPLLLRAGRAYAALGETDTAQEVFRQVTLQFPRTGGASEAFLALGHLALAAADYTEALTMYTRSETTATGAAQGGLAALHQGLVQQQMGEVAASLDPLARAVEGLLPDTPEGNRARLALAAALNQTERFDDALDILDAMGTNPAPAHQIPITLERAAGLYLAGDVDEALAAYQSLTVLTLTDAQLGRVMLGTGRILEAQGAASQATDAYRAAADAFFATSSPPPEEVLLARESHEAVVRLLGADAPLAAAEYLERLAHYTPDHGMDYLYRAGLFYRDAGAYDTALATFHNAAAAASQNHPLADDIGYAHATCYEAAGRYPDALYTYGAFIAAFPGSPLTDDARAARQRLERHQILDEAERDLRRIDLTATHRLEADGPPLESLLQLADYYFRYAKDFSAAMEKCSQILEKTPSPLVRQEALALAAQSAERLAEQAVIADDAASHAQFSARAGELYRAYLVDYADTPFAGQAAMGQADIVLQLLPAGPKRAQKAKIFYSPLLDHPEVGEAALSQLATHLTAPDVGLPVALMREGIAAYQRLADAYPNSDRAEAALYLAGRSLYRMDDFDGARETLLQHRSRYPLARHSPETLDLLATLDLRDQNYAAASARHVRLVEQFGYAPLASGRHVSVGDAYMVAGQFAPALTEFQAALTGWVKTMSGDSAQVNAALAHLLPRLRAAYDSLQTPGGLTILLEPLEAQLPATVNHQPALYALGRSYRAIGETTLAIRKFTEASDLAGPLQRDALRLAADLLMETGVYAEAQRVYEQLAENAPTLQEGAEPASLAIISTYRQHRIQQADKAAKIFENQYKKTVTWEEYRWLFALEKGRAYYDLKNFKRAESIFSDVGKRAGKVAAGAEGLFYLGLTYQAQKKNDRATDTFLELLDAHPDHPIAGQVHKQVGAAYSLVGDNGNAVRHYRAAAESPHTGLRDPDAWNRLIIASRHAGWHDSELAALRRYLELFPSATDRFDKQLDVGRALIDMRQPQQAREYLTDLLSQVSQEEEAQVQFYIARSVEEMGLPDLAAAEFLKVLYYGTEAPLEYYAFTLFSLAELSARQGRLETAIGYLAQVLERAGAGSNFGLTAQSRIRELQNRQKDLGMHDGR